MTVPVDIDAGLQVVEPMAAPPPHAPVGLVPETPTGDIKTPSEPAPPDTVAVAPAAHAPATPTQRADAPQRVRIGLDFGTSTTVVSVLVPGETPRLVRIGGDADPMPSYYWVDAEGKEFIGAAARNQPGAIHSVKPLLVDDEPSEATLGMRPSVIAHKIVDAAVHEAVRQLRRDGTITSRSARPELVARIGTTPRFDLHTRVLLRDIARAADLDLALSDVIEEPIAATVELVRQGLLPSGNVLVVDAGGGTTDFAVVKVSPGRDRFVLYATRGSSVACGDRYTEVVRDRIVTEAASRASGVELSRADLSRIWNLAEDAKIRLSSRRSAVVSLPDIHGLGGATIELTRDWFEAATRRITYLATFEARTAYQCARLVLDRGGQGDLRPGTVTLEMSAGGVIKRRIPDIRLEDDGREHLAAAMIVGGVSRMPALQQAFRGLLEERLLDADLLGVDSVGAIALGLGREDAPDSVDFAYPGWQVAAEFANGDGPVGAIPMYEPFAPIFEVRNSETSVYRHTTRLDGAASGDRVRLVFRRVGVTDGVAWPWQMIRPDPDTVHLEIDLFGRVTFSVDSWQIYSSSMRAPWSPSESDSPQPMASGTGLATRPQHDPSTPAWIPAAHRARDWPTPDWFDLRNSGPG